MTVLQAKCLVRGARVQSIRRRLRKKLSKDKEFNKAFGLAIQFIRDTYASGESFDDTMKLASKNINRFIRAVRSK